MGFIVSSTGILWKVHNHGNTGVIKESHLLLNTGHLLFDSWIIHLARFFPMPVEYDFLQPLGLHAVSKELEPVLATRYRGCSKFGRMSKTPVCGTF